MGEMGESVTPLERSLGKKTMLVVSCAVLGIAAVGFAIGIRSEPRRDALRPVHGERPLDFASDVLAAPSYAEIGLSGLGPNRNFVSSVATLKQPPASEPPKKPDPALRHLALLRRESRRAYDGAPPVIPHAVDSQSAASCLTCHENGSVVGDVVARKIPHPVYSQCLQCHVEQRNSRFSDLVLADNSFEGFAPIEFAHRAGTGLPPWTPHSTLLRHDCLACHGPNGDVGLKTSHPERQNCLQCHPPAATLEFEPPLDAPLFLEGPIVRETEKTAATGKP